MLAAFGLYTWLIAILSKHLF